MSSLFLLYMILHLALNGTVPSQIKKRGFRLWLVNSHFVRASARLAEESHTNPNSHSEPLGEESHASLVRDLSLMLKMTIPSHAELVSANFCTAFMPDSENIEPIGR